MHVGINVDVQSIPLVLPQHTRFHLRPGVKPTAAGREQKPWAGRHSACPGCWSCVPVVPGALLRLARAALPTVPRDRPGPRKALATSASCSFIPIC